MKTHIAPFLTQFVTSLCLCLLANCANTQDWRTARRSSAHIAPLPADEPEALVQVYVARTYSWRKYFAVHSWVATKEKNATHYTTYQVTSWHLSRNGKSVEITNEEPDRYWYGAEPALIFQMKGHDAEEAIPHIKALTETYFNDDRYVIWPGPNSNSYIAYLIRHTPHMNVELPPTAIGKDWIDHGDIFAWAQTGTGIQVSVWGALGFTLALYEGIEVNVLGLVFGMDVWRPALKLPLIGRIGFPDASIP